MADYDAVVFTRSIDGTITVEQAPAIIGVSAALLADDSFDRDTHIRDGHLILDTAGTHRYLPVRFADRGHVVVCERITENQPDQPPTATVDGARIRLNTAALAELPPPPAETPVDDDGLFAFSQHRYRPTAFAQDGRVILCERVP